MGNEAYKNGHLDKAKDLYSQAIQLEPNPVFYTNRSVVLFDQDLFDESLKDALKAIELDSKFWKVLTNFCKASTENNNRDILERLWH